MRNSNRPLGILIVDDQELIRLGLRQVLKDVPDIRIIGEAASGEEAIEFTKMLVPDVVLMDIEMQGIGGLEAMKKIIYANPEVKVLALIACNERLYLSRSLQSGASGYLSKNAAANEVLQAIREVYNKQHYISPEIAQRVVFSDAKDQQSPFRELSNRELQIAIMVAKDYSTSEISQHLNLSVKTVNSYCYRIFKKLKIKGRVALVRMVIQCNLLDENV